MSQVTKIEGHTVVTSQSDDASSQSIMEDTYRRHFTELRQLAYLITGSASRAEDIVQDAFVCSAGRMTTLSDPLAYLRVAVVNGCRRSMRRRVLNVDPVAELVHDLSEDGLMIQAALLTLNPRRRLALVLRYYQDLDYEALSQTLGCRPGAARSLVRRALTDMRKHLE
jgi:RNA polymerase sigma factor (sigma-70 family)